MVQILELFGGIGSPRIALRNLGIETKSIDYVEIDEKAVRSYNAIFAKDLNYKTQSVVNWNLKPDILIHGSPCQDISIAGKKLGADQGSGTRSSLMWETLNIIKQMGSWRPRVVIWENVRGVLHKHMRDNFRKYLQEMEALGYSNSFETLDARDFGLPQNRKRVFTISLLKRDAFNFNILRHKKMINIQELLEINVNDNYVIKSPSMLSRLPGASNSSFNGRLVPIDQWSYTITTKQNRCPNSGVAPISNGHYRLLTERECWRLQGYSDDDYDAAASVNGRTALYTQAGNSIPVGIFESLFEVLI
ncbi:DNA cytosine methyltransferase [Listeria monocytogenes]|uniref:DNA cytosine methyltransferase n=1 Tax=Listeria monocytogenes TaxID=1639 RepID=UPI0011EAC0B6|nr:DNA cytosine methyltransferase [Listeria monocytogenes]EAE8591312.1 DNA cytosine methyltransferase [Listeria monocytogenes]EAF5198074.1 DNA cytosine methyltransferase [Listeria monocytogenes]EDH0970678.1 DNA (cytosine-5-)-methyltransferase [Listeria monocytogenes]EHG1764848.1 DNA cytosine methyltransferase [Listeria monocytogenes]TYU83378.1 DNA cytosine methyltransferase [Listeria monocytogenes]